MIYLDSSVALAYLLGENHAPPDSLWSVPLMSSRLLEYEVWNRINARRPTRSVVDHTRLLIGRISFVALSASVLDRALEPFPIAVRTLDALHLASMEFVRRQGQTVELASYDERLRAAARALGFSLAEV